eukprot:snap_masked-scaffold_8-processed-gene-5.16-mRNA-1 protein AED:1.00 eAED:1.00 QI:0/-1/0/0/-1/1/1/0/114
MNQVANSVEVNHDRIFNKLERRRRKARDALNKRFKLEDLQYQIGNWVLVATKGTKSHREKLRLRWAGPYKIVGITGSHLYEVENIDNKKSQVYAQRLKFYCGNWMHVDELVKSS